MGLEQTPVREMPSIPEIAQRKNVNFNNRAPRFWMEANYDAVAVSADEKVWQLRGQAVKTMTEDSFFDKDGVRHRAKGKSNKYAKAWADSMTKNYEALSKGRPSFPRIAKRVRYVGCRSHYFQRTIAGKDGFELGCHARDIESCHSKT